MRHSDASEHEKKLAVQQFQSVTARVKGRWLERRSDELCGMASKDPKGFWRAFKTQQSNVCSSSHLTLCHKGQPTLVAVATTVFVNVDVWLTTVYNSTTRMECTGLIGLSIVSHYSSSRWTFIYIHVEGMQTTPEIAYSCAVLCCAVLCCSVLCCSVLLRAAPCCAALCCVLV